MDRLFKNQILITKKEASGLVEYNTTLVGEWYIYSDINIPIIRTDSKILIGWAWDCRSGKTISVRKLNSLNSKEIVEESSCYTGRYLLFVNDRYIYTDATSSYALYYSQEGVSTNLALLGKILGVSINCEKKHSETLTLPPKSGVKDIGRLMPGEYYDIEKGLSISIKDYLVYKGSISVEKAKDQIISILKNCARGIVALTNNDYRLMLTGGKDSRLSLLSLYSIYGSNIKSFTHKKQVFMNDVNDINTPQYLSKKMKFNHLITKAKNRYKFPHKDLIEKHAPIVGGTLVPGSTYYYYLKSNWFQIEEEFLIDNYYEIGRMHLHNKGYIRTEDNITFENVLKYGYSIDEESFEAIMQHINIVGGSVNNLDTFYFVKNYINVANQFELIDYSHTPLIFCNSLLFIRLLLNIPESLRANSKFHMELLESLRPLALKMPECNKKSNTKIYKIKNRARKLLAKIIVK